MAVREQKVHLIKKETPLDLVYKRIEETYALLQKEGLATPRGKQIDLSKQIAHSFLEEKRFLAEAPTGTGKTLAYLIGALVASESNGKEEPTKVVVATATVALQEQILKGDLPKLIKIGLIKESSIISLKGRGRYYCRNSAELVLYKNKSTQFDMFDTSFNDELSIRENVQEFNDAFCEGGWDGELDSFKGNTSAWSHVAANVETCIREKCEFFEDCPYQVSRKKMNVENITVIVTNQDMVLADLMLKEADKSGIFAKEYFCVFDEAHHLPKKAQACATSQINVLELKEIAVHIKPLCVRWDKVPELRTMLLKKKSCTISELLTVDSLIIGTNHVDDYCDMISLGAELPFIFEGDEISKDDSAFRQMLLDLGASVASRLEILKELSNWIKEFNTDNKSKETKQAISELLFQFSYLISFFNEANNAFTLFMDTNNTAGDSIRWLDKTHKDTYVLNRAPLGGGPLLYNILWSKPDLIKAALVSATLKDVSGFERFKEKIGLKEDNSVITETYPHVFDYKKHNMYWVKMENSPKHGNRDLYVEEFKSIVADFINPHEGTLIIFPTRAMLKEVVPVLKNKLGSDKILVQGSKGIQNLIDEHKKRIDNGQGSVLCGLDTMSEGLDLPGLYCTHVIICTFPFAACNTPLEKEMQTRLGLKYFEKRLLPDAFVKLVQMVGRLIRKETDFGRVTLFDNRFGQDWGQNVLRKLPPFKITKLNPNEGKKIWKKEKEA